MNNVNNNIKLLPEGFFSAISLNSLRISVNLGVGQSERNNKQEVDISFKFFYKQPPEGFYSDNIKDTICYHQISEIVKNYCNSRQFRLLEYLCNGLCAEVRKVTPVDVGIWIMVEKCNPPIENLIGSNLF